MTRRIEMLIGGLAVVLLLVLLVGVVGVLYARPATAQTSAGVPGMRQITVIGHGEAAGRPDRATVQIGVETEATTAQDALAQNTARAQAVITKLKDLGVAERDVQTSNFSIYPTYATDGRQVMGYHVSNSVSVTIRKLDEAGTLLDQVVQTGANSVNGISFSVENDETLMEQARKAAIQHAQAEAEQLAQTAGAAVGEVLVITQNVGSAPPQIFAGRAALADSSAPVPVQPGEQRFSVDVQVTFALK